MVFVNLTPHKVRIIKPDGSTVEVGPSGVISRVSVNKKQIGEIDGIPVYQIEYGKVQDLPEPVSGTIYIVAQLVKAAASDRKDLVSPDTSDPVRDGEGNIVGVKGFVG